MLQFIAGRLVQMIPVLLGVSLIAIFSIHLVPGDPIEIMTLGRATPETIAAMHAEYGLDQPLWQQYATFLGNALQGDLGRSIVQKTEVTNLIADGIGVTLYLLAYSAVLSVLIAVPLAMWAAVRRDSAPDHAVRLGSMIGLALPPFWIGLLLMVVFGLTLRWFPIRGFGEGFFGHLHHMFLPALTMALFLAPILIQSLRSSILDVLEADYIEDRVVFDPAQLLHGDRALAAFLTRLEQRLRAQETADVVGAKRRDSARFHYLVNSLAIIRIEVYQSGTIAAARAETPRWVSSAARSASSALLGPK